MISALSTYSVGVIINRLIDGCIDMTKIETNENKEHKAKLEKVIEFDKSISYNPSKKYDMFDGDFAFEYVYIGEDIHIVYLYFNQPLLDSQAISSTFGNTNTAIHFTTIRAQMPVIEYGVISECTTFIVSTRYAVSLFYCYDIRGLIDYIQQLLLKTVLKKMPASVRGILPNGRTYKSIDEYVKLCIIFHLYSKWFGIVDDLECLYDKIEPLRLYKDKDDFYDQNFSLYKITKQLTKK